MKEKRYVTLSDYERRIIVLSLNRLRNRVIADGIDPIDVDRMLLKMARVGAMNSIRQRATEIVHHDLIYT